MPKEIEYQRRICNSIRTDGGHGRKWASEWQAGAPDLVLAHPDIGGFLMEVKLEKIRNPNWRRRAIKLTPLQEQECPRYSRAGMLVVIGVVLEYPRAGEAYLVVVGDDCDVIEPDMVSQSGPHLPGYGTVEQEVGGYFDVPRAMHQYLNGSKS